MNETSGSGRASGTDRAQSVFDFSIGVSLFLIVVIAVLVFLPTAFAALDDGGGVSASDRNAANRAADTIVSKGFGDSDRPNTFNYFCLIAFFDDRSDCGFEAGRSPAADASLDPQRPLNVTASADLDADGRLERLCWNGNAPATEGGSVTPWVPAGDSECQIPFATETSAAANVEYTSATRVGTLQTLDRGGTSRPMVYVTVRTW